MRINNNIMAYNAHRQLSMNSFNVSRSTEKLSSGFRINRAGDDAAGLAISEKMRGQIRGLSMASKNSQDAISLIQTAEGALTETHSILQRMRELAVQSASDTNQNDVDREALDAEFQALKDEIDDIAQKTAFNGQALLKGTFGGTPSVSGGTITSGTGYEFGGATTLDANVQEIDVSGAQADTYTFVDSNGELALQNSSGETYAVSVSINGVADTSVASADMDDWAAGDLIEISSQEHGVSITMTVEVTDSTGSGNVWANFATAGDQTVTVASTAAKIQTGADSLQQTDISIGDMQVAALGLTAADVLTNGDASAGATQAIDLLDDAINTVSTERSELGALQNRLEHKIANLNTSAENLQAAESRIRDLDMAQEMTKFTKNNILTQAATAMLAQANAAPQSVLQLLQ